MRPTRLSATHSARRGFSLLEVTVVMTIMGVMLAIPAPMFFRAVEQSKLDVAAGNLRAIWGAQRFYYLEYGRFGTLDELAPDPDPSVAPSSLHAALIEPTIAAVPSETFYTYTIELADDGLGQSFDATATHPATPSLCCIGSISIDESGTFDPDVSVTYNSIRMYPSLEPKPLEPNP